MPEQMIIRSARFIQSSTSIKQLPDGSMPEFAFIGRSNVGKSSLINLLTHRKKLAKISATPGKTRTINHFLINETWYLVDLPGYGYAKVSKSIKADWEKLVLEYISHRNSLCLLFVLLDVRHEPFAADLEFMHLLGRHQIPFARVFTKADKISGHRIQQRILQHDQTMLKEWEDLPPALITSARDRRGKDELLKTIADSYKLCTGNTMKQ